MWICSSAFFRRNLVRRTMTSIWCFVHSRTKESIERVRGTPPERASMFAEKFSCSWVCL